MTKIFKHVTLAIALAVIVGASGPSAQVPNGADPRPFYVVAHNANTTVDVLFALQAGANALEPDLTVLPPGWTDVLLNPDPAGLVVYHDHINPTTRVPQTLEDWLDGVHLLAKQYPQQLAMIMFDIKSPAATCANGLTIQSLAKSRLNFDGVDLNIIYNVGSKADAVAFHDLGNNCYGILGQLGEREGVMIDGEDSPEMVIDALKTATNENFAYGDGTLALGPNLPRILDRANFLRASEGLAKWNYVYTIDRLDTMNDFINSGVDGIIPDFPDPFHPEFDLNQTPAHIQKLKILVGAHPEIRMAVPGDNLFQPALQAYGLQVKTMDTNGAGTDAKLTFTLNGCRGSSSVTVDTGFIHSLLNSGRMERNQLDYVTLPSLNLGKLSSIEVYNDGSGIDPFPDWDLADITVSSSRWLGLAFFQNAEYKAVYDSTIVAKDPAKKLNLTPMFTEPTPTIECPAPITVNNTPGQCNAVVTFAPKVDGMCADVTAVSLPPSGSTFNVGATIVDSNTVSPSFPNDPATCSFSVTVKDVEAPGITCPAPVSIAATGPSGVAVSFAPAATDNCSATTSSLPPSGSLFPIGTTNVTSMAQDPSGNQSSCGFTVHVKGALEQTSDLVTVVNGLSINKGTKNALLAKLNEALAKLQNGGPTGPVCGSLEAFINLATAQRGKQLTLADADTLIAAATQIRAVAGCPA